MKWKKIAKQMAEEIGNLRYIVDDETGIFETSDYYKPSKIIEEYIKDYGGITK